MRALFITSVYLFTAALSACAHAGAKDELSAELRQWSDQNIAKYRQATVTLEIADKGGALLEQTPVRIQQTNKQFCFGSALNEWVVEYNQDFAKDDPRKFRNWFEEHFNCGTPASTLHWQLMENENGSDGVGVSFANNTIAWMQERDMQTLGHAVTWEKPDLVPYWVKAASDAESLKNLLQKRVKNLVGGYTKEIDHWVGINEMLDYDSISAQFDTDDFTFRPWLYKEIKRQQPKTKLLVNEAGILAEPGRVDEYKNLVNELRAAGAPIDIVGVQAHFWPRDQELIDFDKVKERLDALAELGLPIWITEFDYAHEDEQVRANQLEGFFRIAYAHPAVEAIKIWGYWEGAHWRADWGTPVALIDKDWRVAASGERLGELMQEWSTNTVDKTDKSGRLQFSGYTGDYVATFINRKGNTVSRNFSLHKDGPAVIKLQ